MKSLDAALVRPEDGAEHSRHCPTAFGKSAKCPGWITNGRWLIYIGRQRVAHAGYWKRDIAGMLEAMRKAVPGGIPLKEVRGLRIANGPGTWKDCPKCAKRKTDNPKCAVCYGQGGTGEWEFGQRVYRSENGLLTIIAADMYGAMLDGLSIRAAEHDRRSALLGIDDVGDLVAVVMPVAWDGEPRQPSKAEA